MRHPHNCPQIESTYLPTAPKSLALFLPSYTNTLHHKNTASKMVLTGRGGYGNHVSKKQQSLSPKTSPVSPHLQPQQSSSAECDSVPSTLAPVLSFSSPSQRFTTGRGGYGNRRPISQMMPDTPEEYLEECYTAYEYVPPVYSVGRGGLGNKVTNHKKEKEPEKEGNRLTRMFSNASNSSNSSQKSRNSLHAVRSEPGRVWAKLKTTMTN